MEVPGKRDEDIVHLNLKRYNFFCQPCDGEGQHVKAEGFCQNCQEYLCNNCCTFHRKVTVTKHHVILDKQSMPRHKSTKQQIVVCTERCKKHTTEIIKFFCEAHDIVGCSDCITLGHKQCHIDYIPDIAEKFVKNEEHKKLLTRLDDLQAQIVDEEKSSVDKAERVGSACNEAVGYIKRYRQEINAYLDKKEQELVVKFDSVKKENAVTTESINDRLKCIKKELGELKKNIETKQKNVADLFVEAQQGKSCLKHAEESFDETMAMQRVKMPKFVVNVDWRNMISKEIPIGELSVKPISEMTPASMEKINVRSKSDKNKCLISSMVLTSSGDILCTDRSNKTLKVIDTKKHQLSSEITLSSGPWDITAISNTFQFAVTLPNDKKIQLILFNGNVSLLNTINTDGPCRGIAYYNDTLIVSFAIDGVCPVAEKKKIEIINLQGNVLKMFNNSFYNKEVFAWPSHVAVDQKRATIYVSDVQLNSVVQLQMNGTILTVYKDQAFEVPRSMNVCANGSVLVCGEFGKCLLLISEGHKDIKTMLRNDKELDNPLAVCFNETENILYVTNFTHEPDNVLVFRMS